MAEPVPHWHVRAHRRYRGHSIALAGRYPTAERAWAAAGRLEARGGTTHYDISNPCRCPPPPAATRCPA